MLRLASAALACVVVSACAGGPGYGPYGPYGRDYRDNPPVRVGPDNTVPPDPLARSMTFTCEDLTTVTLTEGQRSAQVTFNSGGVLSLDRMPDAMGFRYGVPPHEFRGRGTEGTLFNNNRAVRCRVK